MPDANMTEAAPATNVNTPQRNGTQTVASTPTPVSAPAPAVTPPPVRPAPVPLVNATVVAAAAPAAAPPLAAVQSRTELIITRGIYKKFKRGWLDETRGHGGYSPSRKSVYITYLDNGVERIASNCIRSTSVTLVNWSTPLNSTNPHLQSHPEVTTHLAQLSGMLQDIPIQNAAEARQLRNDLKQLMVEILRNGVQIPPGE